MVYIFSLFKKIIRNLFIMKWKIVRNKKRAYIVRAVCKAFEYFCIAFSAVAASHYFYYLDALRYFFIFMAFFFVVMAAIFEFYAKGLERKFKL